MGWESTVQLPRLSQHTLFMKGCDHWCQRLFLKGTVDCLTAVNISQQNSLARAVGCVWQLTAATVAKEACQQNIAESTQGGPGESSFNSVG